MDSVVYGGLLNDNWSIDSLFLPSPSYLWSATVDLFVHKQFLFDIGISVFRVFSAFALAFVIAVPTALLMTECAFVKRLLEPYIDFIRYLPVPALIPLISWVIFLAACRDA